MNDNFIISKPASKDDFFQYFDLRWRILRKPLNQKKGSERDNLENNCHHICIKDQNSKIVAVGRIHFISNEKKQAQIRYMAVEEKFQKQGLGQKILNELEAIALLNNVGFIFLEARENAVEFYKKNGYSIKKKSHILYDLIQHWTMYKKI